MKIGIIGAGGRLGSALTNLVLKNNHTPLLSFSHSTNEKNKNFLKTTKHIIPESDILFLCVKPKDVENVLDEINKYPLGHFLVVSCAASIPFNFIESKLNKKCKVVRIMPNLPIVNGKGVITYFPSRKINKSEHNVLMEILKGPKIFEVREEEKLNISTVLTGSMPAFIAYVVKAHLNCFTTHFNEVEALELYIATMEGTLDMLRTQSSDEIIKNVSSPGGITEKGIKILEDSKVNSIIEDSIWASISSCIEPRWEDEFEKDYKN